MNFCVFPIIFETLIISLIYDEMISMYLCTVCLTYVYLICITPARDISINIVYEFCMPDYVDEYEEESASM